MKIHFILFAILAITFFGFSQERILTFSWKDSVNNIPKFKGNFGSNIKLNSYYDLFGGLQDGDTFNILNINVFDNNDDESFKMDIYQTRMKLESSIAIKKAITFKQWNNISIIQIINLFTYVSNSYWHTLNSKL